MVVVGFDVFLLSRELVDELPLELFHDGADFGLRVVAFEGMHHPVGLTQILWKLVRRSGIVLIFEYCRIRRLAVEGFQEFRLFYL